MNLENYEQNVAIAELHNRNSDSNGPTSLLLMFPLQFSIHSFPQPFPYLQGHFSALWNDHPHHSESSTGHLHLYYISV